MALNFLNTRLKKIVFTIVVVLVVLVLVPALFLNSYLEPKLTDKLKTGVLKATDSLYHIEFSDADLHVLRGSAVLHNIVLKADTAVYRQMKQRGNAPGSLYEVHVKQLDISNAHPFKLYFSKKLDIGQISLDAPQVLISKYDNKNKTDSASKDKRTLYQKISKSLKFIHVSNINLDNIAFTYKNYTVKKPAVSKFSNMSIEATDLLIDSATQADTSRTLFCKDIVTQLHKFSGQSANGLYKYNAKLIRFSTRTARLIAAGINLQPLSAKAFFAKSKSDRFELHLDTIILNNFDFENYNQKGDISISNLVLKKGSFEVYSNPNGTLKTTDRLVTFPHWAVRQLKTSLNIDTLRLKNLDVTYREYKKKSQKTGSIKFMNTNGRFLNITNKKELLQRNNICKVNLSTRFMGKAGFNLSFTFNLNDADYKYSYQGHLGPMDLQVVNPAVMPLGMVQITSGRLKSLDFDIHSTQKTSTGTVTFLYNNLKVNVLKRDEDEKDGYDKKSLISIFANTFVLKHDNPDDGSDSPRSATVAFIRPSNFPFFKTIWFTLLNGIKACASGSARQKDEKTTSSQKQEARQEALKKAREQKADEDKRFKQKLGNKPN